jgi:hypothetical protein
MWFFEYLLFFEDIPTNNWLPRRVHPPLTGTARDEVIMAAKGRLKLCGQFERKAG